MKNMKFKIVSVIVAGIVLFGCSNQSPVSVDSTTRESAYLSSLSVQDIGVNGTHLWAVSYNVAPTGSDYYLYKYNQSTSYWDATSSYGKRVAVAPSGACYHINSANQIWWRKIDGSYGQIPNPPNNNILLDIGCGPYGSYDYLWVIDQNPQGTRTIYKYRPNKSPQWIWVTNGRTDADRIAADPTWGNRAAICAGGSVYTTTNESAWYQQTGAPANCTDVGIYWNKLIVSQSNGIYTGYGTSFTWQTWGTGAVCADVNFAYHRDLSDKVAEHNW